MPRYNIIKLHKPYLYDDLFGTFTEQQPTALKLFYCLATMIKEKLCESSLHTNEYSFTICFVVLPSHLMLSQSLSSILLFHCLRSTLTVHLIELISTGINMQYFCVVSLDSLLTFDQSLPSSRTDHTADHTSISTARVTSGAFSNFCCILFRIACA